MMNALFRSHQSRLLHAVRSCRLAAAVAVLSIVFAGAHPVGFGASTARAAAKQMYNLTSLGQLGGQGADAASMNAKGEIVGGTGPYCGAAVCAEFAYGSEAFVWRDGKLIDLGPGAANEINKHEEIAGQAFDAGGNSVAALWRNDKPFNNAKFVAALKKLGGPGSAAFGVNDKGVIVGDSQVNFTTQNPNECSYVCHAFSYDPTASHPMTNLGPHGALSGQALAVNDSDVAVGQANGSKFVSWISGLQLTAVTWHHGQMKTLPAPSQTLAFADSINATGEVAGGVSLKQTDPSDSLCPRVASANTPLDYAAAWNKGKLTLLRPSGSFPDSVAYAINDKGVVGGGLHNACEFQDAAIWTKGRVLDLTKVTPALPNGTQLRYVVAVADNGNIVATAADEQKQEIQSYLLTPCSSHCTTKIAQSTVINASRLHSRSRSISLRQRPEPASTFEAMHF